MVPTAEVCGIIYALATDGNILCVSRISRHRADIGYHGERKMICLEKEVEAGSSVIRVYTFRISIDGDQSPTEEKDIELSIPEKQVDSFNNILASLSKIGTVEEVCWTDKYAYGFFSQLFYYLGKHCQDTI